MKKLTFGISAVLIFLAGAGLFLSAKTSTESVSPKSFVAVFQDVDVDSAGNRAVRQIRIQTLKGHNEYSLRVYNLQSGKETRYISAPEGIYEVLSDCVQFFGPALNPELPSPVALKSTQGFVREEKVLGINAHVFRVEQGNHKKFDKAQQRVDEYKKGGAAEVGESLRKAIEKRNK